jgi:hypothetical protein
MKVTWRNILILIGLILAVVLLVDFNRRMEELNRLTSQLKVVQVEATAVVQTQTALASQVAYATSDAAVEAWAYNNKMVRPGEHPVGIVPEGNVTPTPLSTTIQQEQNPPTWRIWWELFFGNRP